MATFYIDQKNITLKADGARLKIFHQGDMTTSVPLGQLERIVASAPLQLDTGVLSALQKHQVGFAAINPRKASRSVIIAGYSHNDVQRRLAHYQKVNENDFCSQLSCQLVRHKIKQQHRLLCRMQQRRPDQRLALRKASQSLKKQLDGLRHHESQDMDNLRGIEGSAAAIYFQGMASVFPPSLNFNGRNRRPPRDPVNACLSLGYTLLHFDAVIAIQRAGLDPMLGFYHRPAFARESLASDLIEPLRPGIDAWVWHLFSERQLEAGHFHDNQGACLLGKTGRKIFYSGYEQMAASHRRQLRRMASGLAKTISGDE